MKFFGESSRLTIKVAAHERIFLFGVLAFGRGFASLRLLGARLPL